MIYFIRCGRYVKIGYTKQSLKRRLEDLQIGNPVALEALAMIEGDVKAERRLQDRFLHLRVRGEWYRLTEEVRGYIAENVTRSLEEIDRDNRRQWAQQAFDRMHPRPSALPAPSLEAGNGR